MPAEHSAGVKLGAGYRLWRRGLSHMSVLRHLAITEQYLPSIEVEILGVPELLMVNLMDIS
jgi:hypothetical protein